MSIGTSPDDFIRRLLATCFIHEKLHALRMKAGRRPRIWHGERETRPFGFRTREVGRRTLERVHIEAILRLVPEDSPALESLEETGACGFFLADYPAIVYAEKRNGEIELFIHLEPTQVDSQDDEEE
jgi:hypothetical protein